MSEVAVLERANELYWGSDKSVNQIAEDMDLSKGRLYELIRPLGTGLLCPLCGAEADFPNRTAKEKSKVMCPECEFEGTEDELVDPDVDASLLGEQMAHATDHTYRPLSKRVFWGTVLIGAAAGIAIIRSRRRSS